MWEQNLPPFVLLLVNGIQLIQQWWAMEFATWTLIFVL